MAGGHGINQAQWGLGNDNEATDLEELTVGGHADPRQYTLDAAEPNEFTGQYGLVVSKEFAGEALFDDAEDTQDIGVAIFARVDRTRTEAYTTGYGGELFGVYGEAVDSSTLTSEGEGLFGVSGVGIVTGGDDMYAIGVQGSARHFTSTASGVEMIGVDAVATHFNATETTDLTAIRAFPFIAGTGTIVSHYGLKVDGGNSGGKQSTNAYGIYIKDKSALGATIARNIYSAGATAINEFVGRVVMGAPNSAIADGDLAASEMSFYLNEAGNTVTVKAKYAGGTVKTGTIALT